jgi:hypothetical protein
MYCSSPFDQPDRPQQGVDSLRPQHFRPVVGQVDAYRNTSAAGPLAGESLVFNRDHLRLVDLVNACAVMPWQSVRAGVHARGQNDHLRHAVGLHPQQRLVE